MRWHAQQLTRSVSASSLRASIVLNLRGLRLVARSLYCETVKTVQSPCTCQPRARLFLYLIPNVKRVYDNAPQARPAGAVLRAAAAEGRRGESPRVDVDLHG